MMRLAKKIHPPVRKLVEVVKALPEDQDLRFTGGFFYLAKPRPFFQDAGFAQRQERQDGSLVQGRS